jgi:hypothetical protein
VRAMFLAALNALMREIWVETEFFVPDGLARSGARAVAAVCHRQKEASYRRPSTGVASESGALCRKRKLSGCTVRPDAAAGVSTTQVSTRDHAVSQP